MRNRKDKMRFGTTLGAVSFVFFQLACLSGAIDAHAEEAESAVFLGKKLYVRNCSLCHGADGRGNTEVSELIRVATPDLTTIGARRGGWFPEVLVREIIDGRFTIHGDGKMPIWGNTLSQTDMIAITEYLFSLQPALP